MQNLNDKGYTIYRNFLSEDELSKWEDAIRSLFHYQALKLGFYSHDMDELLIFFESKSKVAGYQCALQCESSLGGKQFVSLPKFDKLFKDILGSDFLTILGPFLLTNIPESKRLIYHWHTEYHFHPKRKNFVNVWIPVFRSKKAGNGTLVLGEATHKKHWEFVEYSGYDKDNLGDKKAYTQYETVINEPIDEVVLELDRKDIVIFDGNLLHKSTINKSNDVTYATSIRVFDTSKDPTLSANMIVQPYVGHDIGYPGLIL